MDIPRQRARPDFEADVLSLVVPYIPELLVSLFLQSPLPCALPFSVCPHPYLHNPTASPGDSSTRIGRAALAAGAQLGHTMTEGTPIAKHRASKKHIHEDHISFDDGKVIDAVCARQHQCCSLIRQKLTQNHVIDVA